MIPAPPVPGHKADITARTKNSSRKDITEVASTPTPIMPATTRLDGDLRRGEEILAQARQDMDAAGRDTPAYTRTVLYPASPERVDALAARWGVKAEWRAGDSQYAAFTGNPAGEIEAVWFRPALHAGSEAAA